MADAFDHFVDVREDDEEGDLINRKLAVGFGDVREDDEEPARPY
jgi:hypothetical protein